MLLLTTRHGSLRFQRTHLVLRLLLLTKEHPLLRPMMHSEPPLASLIVSLLGPHTWPLDQGLQHVPQLRGRTHSMAYGQVSVCSMLPYQ